MFRYVQEQPSTGRVIETYTEKRRPIHKFSVLDIWRKASRLCQYSNPRPSNPLPTCYTNYTAPVPCRWQINIKIDLKKTCGYTQCIHMT